MDKKTYDEMINNLEAISSDINLYEKNIFLFGHCSASLELADLLEQRRLTVTAILDNSDQKRGITYKNIKVVKPDEIMNLSDDSKAIVLIVSRFYASMSKQLCEIGYKGLVRKVVDYNSFAEYSLSDETIKRMMDRKSAGEKNLADISSKYPNTFKVFCPFSALGDIYYMISYWQSFAKKRNIEKVVFCVLNRASRDVILMFGDYSVEIYGQKELDSMIQAVICNRDEDAFIAHQDRPYVINLSKALYVKRITFEQIYCCGVYGLPLNTIPDKPLKNVHMYRKIDLIEKGRSVIFSPYAKSVTSIDIKIWNDAVDYYLSRGYKCYTNVVGNEKPLERTIGISPSIQEMMSLVEYAGIFIGLRSGLCDVIREAKAKKIALYPDYNYCDTEWKAIDMYWIDQFDYNLLVTEKIRWENL